MERIPPKSALNDATCQLTSRVSNAFGIAAPAAADPLSAMAFAELQAPLNKTIIATEKTRHHGTSTMLSTGPYASLMQIAGTAYLPIRKIGMPWIGLWTVQDVSLVENA